MKNSSNGITSMFELRMTGREMIEEWFERQKRFEIIDKYGLPESLVDADVAEFWLAVLTADRKKRPLLRVVD